MQQRRVSQGDPDATGGESASPAVRGSRARGRAWLRLLTCVLCLLPAALRAQTGLESPAGSGSLAPHLSRGADGRVRISWIERLEAGEVALRFAVFAEGRWSPARTVARGADWFVNWADVPRIAALADGTLAASWLQRLGPGTYSYGVRVSLSRDGGDAWSAPVWLHEDRSRSEHGFVSLVATAGGFEAVWLDGRDHADSGNMTLRARAISREGKLGQERLLDDRVCECCPTDLTVVSGKPVVVYRDRDPKELRDIGIVRSGEGGWGKPGICHADHWKTYMCPVNGPRVVDAGDGIAVAWYTKGTDDVSRVLLIRGDAGGSFGEPMEIAVEDAGTGKEPMGRVGLARGADGTLDVVWLQVAGTESAALILGRRVAPDGVLGEARVLAQTTAGRASGVPVVAHVPEGLLLAWTDTATDRVLTRLHVP